MGIVFTLCTALFGMGYNYREIKAIEPRVTDLEQKGSIQAQISAKDIQWLKERDQEILNEVREVKSLIITHMTQSK